MLRATPPIDGRAGGFTIIEVLVALAVVAVSIVAIGSVMSTNVRGVRSLEQHVTLMQTVRSVMAADVPPRAEMNFGTLSGKTNGHQWKIDVGPMGEEWNASSNDAAWIPALVRIQVRSPSGAVMDVRTVRLMHGKPQ
ncbi:prepilin-type N-terminal cleavage/methylation domain-containing protein [Bradyrhizobium sp.]|uniref:prepilin-type N-terminal cleavage/methylation domain-containing protein n=1 Tax=Bradyrhizobium sp. TaxID=376 RepID=UPI003C410746